MGDPVDPPNLPTVVLENRNLKSPPFQPSSDNITAGKEWEEWIENIEREFRYFKIPEGDKCDALIIYGGREVSRLSKSLPDPPDPDNALSAYDKLKTKLDEYFTPQKNKHHARYLFLKMKPNTGETICVFAARLREKASECEFGAVCDDRILEHLIQTIDNQSLIQKAINKKWNLTQFLVEAGQTEDISMQIKDMKTEEGRIYKVQKHARKDREERKWTRGRSSSQKQNRACSFCGLSGIHPPGKNCPAYGKQCNKCKKHNHFAKVCRSSDTKFEKKDRHSKDKSRHERMIKKTRERSNESTSSDEEFFCKATKHLQAKRVKKTGSSASGKTVLVRIEDVDVHVEPDSGSDVNLMDEHQFKALVHRSREKIELTSSDVKLTTLQSDLSVKGQFHATVRNRMCGKREKFLVLRGHIDSPPLLSRKTLEDLGMMKICEDGSMGKENELKIPEKVRPVMEKETQGIQEIVTRHQQIFEGIGLIRDKKRDREIYGTFCMKPDAVPVAQKARHVPYYLQAPLKKWLDEGLKEEIFEEVPQGEPVTWCSPLVVQPKPRYSKVESDKLEGHMIRASVDLRIPNKHMERSRIIQATVVEDFAYKFRDCKVFSKLDMKQGYHQLLLDQKSREVVTFSTPWGNMRPKRLVFGAKASQDLFDEAVYKIFCDIPKCLNQRDDILLGGSTLEEHNRTLETVLQRAEDFGITFNKEKCQFGVEEIEFYGYLFTKNGLKPTEDKVAAIKKSSPPENKTAVRSFLGMVGYLSKFIPRYSSLTAPLRELTHKNERFKWGQEEETSFELLKNSISSEDTIAYFNPSRPIIVRTEASFNEGLSAGLFQVTPRGVQPVHFISRAMTNTEKRYSQTEKDALAIAWAKKRFRQYLLGAPHFKIITAHKPLLPLFNRPTAKLTPRIERWVMEMQDVDFELVYEPGKDEADPLDFLSRHPVQKEGTDSTERMIKKIVTTEHAVVLKDFKKETLNDDQLSSVKERIWKGDWEKYRNNDHISPFYMIRDELYEAEDLVFRQNQICVPKSLQKKVIKAAHGMGHFGMSKTKNLLRSRYWFPRMNVLVEDAVGRCYQCSVTTKINRNEPVKIMNIPENPWETVSIDFGGPYPDGHYNLVVIDKRTRFPEVERVYSTAFKPTREKLKKIFSVHGTPRRVESDNGPPFNSHDFSKFAQEEGFIHHRITPEHPRANGEAESFMKILNKTEQIARLEGKNMNIALSDMLTGYRATPHPATGVSPYESLMKRTVRCKLDHPGKKQELQDEMVNIRDKQYKEMARDNVKKKYTREHNLEIGDYVLLKQVKKNKWSTAYEPVCYIIYAIHGSTVSARRLSDGRQITRDSSQFKNVNNVVHDHGEQVGEKIMQEDNSWRKRVLSAELSRSVEDEEGRGNTTPRETEQQHVVQTDHGADETAPETAAEMTTPMTTPAVSTPVVTTSDEPVADSRPRRSRRQPKYLQDYVT